MSRFVKKKRISPIEKGIVEKSDYIAVLYIFHNFGKYEHYNEKLLTKGLVNGIM